MFSIYRELGMRCCRAAASLQESQNQGDLDNVHKEACKVYTNNGRGFLPSRRDRNFRTYIIRTVRYGVDEGNE